MRCAPGMRQATRLTRHRRRGGAQPRRRPHRAVPGAGRAAGLSAPPRPRPRSTSRAASWGCRIRSTGSAPPAATRPAARREALDALAAVVDYVEIHNARAYRDANPLAAAFAARARLPGVASSDAHSVMELAVASTPSARALRDGRGAPGAAAVGAAARHRTRLRTSCGSGRRSRRSSQRLRGNRRIRPSTPVRAERTHERRPAEPDAQPSPDPTSPDPGQALMREVTQRDLARSREEPDAGDRRLPARQRGPRGGRGAHQRAAARPAHAARRSSCRSSVLLLFAVALPGFQLDQLVALHPQRQPVVAARGLRHLLPRLPAARLPLVAPAPRASGCASGSATRPRSSSSAGSSTASCRPSWATSTAPTCCKINYPVSLSTTFGTIFIERVFDLIAIVVLGLGAAFWCFRDGLSDSRPHHHGHRRRRRRGPRGRRSSRCATSAAVSSIGCRCPRGSSSSTTCSRRASSPLDRRHVPLVALLTVLIWTTEALRLLFVIEAHRLRPLTWASAAPSSWPSSRRC